jgi:hypothetical protein
VRKLVTIQVGTEGQRHRGTKKNEIIQRFADLAKISRDARSCVSTEIYKISKLLRKLNNESACNSAKAGLC